VLGRAPEPAAEGTGGPIAMASFRPAHEHSSCSARVTTSRTMVVRPGVVYGGGGGMVGDIFKSAANGLVRVVGDGNNHWPLVYDRDLADLCAGSPRAPTSGVCPPTTKATARQRHRVGDQACRSADVRYVPIEEARSKWARTDALARSARAEPARADAQVDADAALGRRKRRAAARRMARRAPVSPPLRQGKPARTHHARRSRSPFWSPRPPSRSRRIRTPAT
jgi:hypothetical protein